MKVMVGVLTAAASLLMLTVWISLRPERNAPEDPRLTSPIRPPSLVQTPESPPLAEPQSTAPTARLATLKGLDYLWARQCGDGHWEGEDGNYPVATTALAGLAILMNMYEMKSQKPRGVDFLSSHPDSLRLAVEWLRNNCSAERGGLIYSNHPSESGRYIEGHALAMRLMANYARLYAEPVEGANLREPLELAGSYLADAQSPRGGWYHTSRLEGHDLDDVVVSTIVLEAWLPTLRFYAHFPFQAVQKADIYLTGASAKYESMAASGQKDSRFLETAAALASYQPKLEYSADLWGNTFRFETFWCDYCQNEWSAGRVPEFGHDELAYYFLVKALVASGGDRWATYREPFFKNVCDHQAKDGSWPAAKGLGDGKIYATALWCLTLQEGLKKPFQITINSRRPTVDPGPD